MTRRWANRKRMTRGGGIEDTLTDTISFSNYYQLKHAQTKGTLDKLILQEEDVIFKIPEGSVLWVIDMQNDFIDAPATSDERPGEHLRLNVSTDPNAPYYMGNFEVNNGTQCVNDINKFIDFNKENLSHVVYTRDWHSPGHCSFGIGMPLYGKYPPHCEYNSLGADLNPAIKAKIDRNDETNKYSIKGTSIPVDIVFKGHHSDADSYTAVPFPDNMDAYVDQRQNQNKNIKFKNASCCQGDACHGKTGAMKLKDPSIDARKCIIHENEKEEIDGLIAKFAETQPGNNVIEEDVEISNKIQKYFESYTLPEPTGQGQIYVVGLAGEFCVKDTAINLALQEKFKGKVNVIQSLTRYPFLPMNIPLQNYEYGTKEFYPYGIWNKKNANEFDLEKIKATSETKALPLYLFEFAPGKNRKLRVDELKNLTLEKVKNLFHLSSDTRSMVDDYLEYGVKLIVNKHDLGVNSILSKSFEQKGYNPLQSKYN